MRASGVSSTAAEHPQSVPQEEKLTSYGDFATSILASAGRVVGISMLREVCRVLVKGFEFLHKRRPLKYPVPTSNYRAPTFDVKDYDLEIASEFEECLHRDPRQLASKILALLKEPSDGRFLKLVMQIIGHYLALSPEGEPTSASPGTASLIEEFLFGLFASPEVLKHCDRIIQWDYSEKAMAYFSVEPFSQKGLSPEVISARRLHEQERATRKDVEKIWYSYRDEFSYRHRTNYELWSTCLRDTESVGGFIVNLCNRFGWRILVDREGQFNPFINAVRESLAIYEIRVAAKYSEPKQLLGEMLSVLESPQSEDALFNLVCKVEEIYGRSTQNEAVLQEPGIVHRAISRINSFFTLEAAES